MTPRVTIDDVAHAAGVSAKTVSRVINGEPHVSKAKRELVERAVAALDFRPNEAARALAASRTFLIGFIDMYLGGFYFSELHRGAIQACRARGFHLVIEELGRDERGAIEALERDLRHRGFEGVVLSTPVTDDDRVLDLLERLELPYVRISPANDRGRSDAVFADEEAGMAMLADHFWRLGHRRIGLATVPTDTVSGWRSDYFAKALVEAGGSRDDLIFAPLDWQLPTGQAGREFAASLLSRGDRPTAIFAYNDIFAAGVVSYALEQGFKVPGDLSVAGFDDSDIARLVWPPLTTVRQPIAEMARAAVSLLLERSATGGPRGTSFPVELIVRGSTGPVQARKRRR